MEGPLKELSKLEKATTTVPSIADSLDSILKALHESKAGCKEDLGEEGYKALLENINLRKKEVDDRQKEVFSAMSRFGKALDKKFSTPLPAYSDLFSSPDSISALERTIALHFLRTGQFDIARTFLEESQTEIPQELRSQFVGLHRILKALRNQDIGPALAWVESNRGFLTSRSSPLEFYLHRSQYMRLLLSSPSDPRPAIAYASSILKSFIGEYCTEFKCLMACLAYLPLSRLQKSPYSDLVSPELHADLEPLFAKEYCSSLGMSRQVPLRVVGDIGGGGALARIEKGRKVMRERKSEWSRTNELPIEIPLPPENRYHSIFACPVSKEQSTESSPPMMMSCGHVISKDSLQKLSKPGGRVKCPYCPAESQLNSVLRIHF